MKYLNKFSIFESSSFEPIDYNTYTKKVYNTPGEKNDIKKGWDEFTKIEIETIASILPVRNTFNETTTGSKLEIFFDLNRNDRIIDSVKITKLKDEWFLCEFYASKLDVERCYKCDQIDGLVDFLNFIVDKIELFNINREKEKWNNWRI